MVFLRRCVKTQQRCSCVLIISPEIVHFEEKFIEGMSNGKEETA
jgi:hypothetical protein